MKKHNNTYPVVYSYRKSLTRELELSIASLKNIKEWDGNIFIIGDKPNLEAEYTHLPVKYKWGKESGFRSNDEVCAYLTAADFLDEFIVMADDIYIFKPWSLERHNRGTLDEHAKSRTRMDSYTKQLIHTRQYLSSNGSPTLSYELHIPFLMKSGQLKVAAEVVRHNRPLFIRSLIGNIYEIPSSPTQDTKNQPITQQTTMYSSSDKTFVYEKVKEYLK